MKEGSQKFSVGGSSLPRPELNPLTNPILGRNLGRWAQVYFTSPPEKREEAVSDLLRELETEPAMAQGQSKVESSVSVPSKDTSAILISTLREARDSVQSSKTLAEIECANCKYVNSSDNRFCGFCGGPLEEEQESSVIAEPVQTESPRVFEQDTDLEWLRNKELASFQVKPGYSFGWVKYTLAIAAMVIAGFLFFQSRGRISPPTQTQPASRVTSQEPRNAVPDRALPEQKNDKGLIQAASLKKEQPRAVPSSAQSKEALDNSALVSGDPDFRLAQTYLQNRNASDAARLLWKAVGRNNTEAALSLSQLYARGEGVVKNCDQARILLVAAAKRGSSAAAQQLRHFDSGVCR